VILKYYFLLINCLLGGLIRDGKEETESERRSRKKEKAQKRARKEILMEKRKLGTIIFCYISVEFVLPCLAKPRAAPLPVFHHNIAA
jgi:hypothetical protein